MPNFLTVLSESSSFLFIAPAKEQMGLSYQSKFGSVCSVFSINWCVFGFWLVEIQIATCLIQPNLCCLIHFLKKLRRHRRLHKIRIFKQFIRTALLRALNSYLFPSLFCPIFAQLNKCLKMTDSLIIFTLWCLQRKESF